LPQGFQNKQRNGHIKAMAISGNKKETAMHGAVRCTQARATGVLERFAGIEQRLMTDHAQSFDLFSVTMRVIDDPMSGDQLRGNRTRVGEGHGIGEMVEILSCLYGRRQEGRRGLNFELVGRHPCMVTATISA